MKLITPSGLVYSTARHVTIMDSLLLYGISRPTFNERAFNKPIMEDVRTLPDVWRINPAASAGKPDFVSMTEDIQHWIFRINVEVLQGYLFQSENEYRAFWKSLPPTHQLIKWFTSIFKGDRSHTNKAGSDTHRNYISGGNPSAEPMKFFQIVTGLWVGELESDRIQNVQGEKCLPLRVINISERDYRNYHPFTHPHLFDQPLLTGRDIIKDKGGLKIIREFRESYSQFNRHAVLPVMLPYDSVGWYPVDRTIAGGMPLRKFG